MSANPLVVLAAVVFIFHVLPVTSHKLITDPYPSNEYNSIIVSSNPIKIYERRQQNDTNTARHVSRARKRSFDECPENDFKCLYGDSQDKDVPDEYFDRYTNQSDLKLDGESSETDLPDTTKNSNPGKSYWSMHHHDHHHPYDDKDGWVTLDPVPWSTSKISKWHPNVDIHESHTPWGFAATTQRPVHQFWVSGSSYRPKRPNIHLGLGSNDIITDNKPSGFPTGSVSSFHSPGFPLNIQHPLHDYGDPFQKFHQNFASQDTYSTRFPTRPHPSTYPSQGNGEWVLLSTKKGYSQPHKWSGKADHTNSNERIFWSRKVKPTEISRYHEEELGDQKSAGKKPDASDTNVKNVTADEKIMVPVQVQYAKGNDSGAKRKVRLQVLPSPQSTLSYGGMLEVDSNPQTVNEALEESKLKKLQTIANVKKNKFRGFRLVPVNRGIGKGSNQRSALTLAAVGAGMIPATMAVLLPMAIGRTKRSLRMSSRNKMDKREWILNIPGGFQQWIVQ